MINYKRILISVIPAIAVFSMVTGWALFNNIEILERISLAPLLFVAVFLVLCNILIVALIKTYNTEKTTVGGALKNSNTTYAPNSIGQFLGMIFPILFLLLFFGIYIYKPLYLIFGSPEYTAPGYTTDKLMWLFSNLIITILTVCLIFVIRIILNGEFKIHINEKTEKIIFISVILLSFIFIFINKLSLFTDITTHDNISIRAGANGLMNDGVIPDSIQIYLLCFPNNRGIVLLLGLLGRFANYFLIPHRLLWIFADSIFITVAVIFTYLTVKLFCNRKVSLVTLVLTAAFLVFSPCITPLANTGGDWYTCYTDSSTMPFIAISIYCFARFLTVIDSNRKKCLLVFLGSISAAIGSLFKPTSFITVIAFVLMLLFYKEKESKRIQNLLKHAVLVLFGISLIVIPFEKIYDHYDTIDDSIQSASMIHYLVMGMLNTGQNINENGTIVFNDQPSLNPFQDRGRWNHAESGLSANQVLIERIRTMNISLLGFYYLKDVNILSFTYEFHSSEFSEVHSPESYYKTPFLENWRSVLLKFQIPVRAILWNIILLQIGVWSYIILKKKLKLLPPECFLSITLLGILAYLTLFESGDRYVMQFWPIFLIAASLGVMRLKEIVTDTDITEV